ncbi:NADH-quinone oxidoreductase subunit N [Colwelliaceae bacterium 6471]
MTVTMLIAISPQLIIAFGICMQLLFIAGRRSQAMIQCLTMAIITLAIVANINLWSIDPISVTPLVKVDSYGVFAFILVAISSFTVALLSRQYLSRYTEVHDEYYVLLLLATLGASILVNSAHFASLFLGFELLSISLVGLVGYMREQRFAVETSFKYLILSASASSFMLLGIALIYSQTGSLSFEFHQVSTYIPKLFHLIGVLLFLVGVILKLSLVPFHFWTPDVYQGAPLPITLLLATVSKVAMFTVLLKCWLSQQYYIHEQLLALIAAIAMLSMLVGNVLALKQQNIKRLLGYSSIAHMGYLLIVLIIYGQQSIELVWQTSLFYLAAYVLANLSIFTVLVVLSSKSIAEDDIVIADLHGLFWQSPMLASLIILAILSLAGIPLTMGFIGKFYLLSYATQAQLWGLISVLIVSSGIGLFYYLKVIFALFKTTDDKDAFVHIYPIQRILTIVFVIAGLILGVFPDFIGNLIITL